MIETLCGLNNQDFVKKIEDVWGFNQWNDQHSKELKEQNPQLPQFPEQHYQGHFKQFNQDHSQDQLNRK